jgi:cell division FtsZ-interacting protein ZapD
VVTKKRVIEIPGNGNCIFSSYCEALYGHHQAEAVQKLREQTIEHIVANFHRYADAVLIAHKTKTAAAYEKKMKTNGEYGDDPEISGISEILNVRTVIYRGPPAAAVWMTYINEQSNEKIVRLHLNM